jgi:hypothetical protein
MYPETGVGVGGIIVGVGGGVGGTTVKVEIGTGLNGAQAVMMCPITRKKTTIYTEWCFIRFSPDLFINYGIGFSLG